MDDPWAPNPEFLAKLDKHFKGADQMQDPIRVLVTGSADWEDKDTIFKALFVYDYAIMKTLVIPASPGAPTLAAEIAQYLGWKIEGHHAHHDLFGAQATYIRDNEIIRAGADVCLVFNKSTPPSAGSLADLAQAAGIKTITHEMRAPVFVNSEMFRIACTAIVFNKEGKMLITRRAYSKKKLPGKWTVPGGGLQTDDFTALEPTIQEGETTQWYGVIEAAVRRKVREDTDLEITKPWIVTDLAFIREDNIPVVSFSYAANLMGPDRVRYNDDTIAHEWVDLEEAKEYDLVEGIIEELKMAKKVWNARDDVDREAAGFDLFNE